MTTTKPPPPQDEWRNKLYQAYVSSGQAMTSPHALDAAYLQRCHYFKARLKTFLPLDRNARVLDLGCGPGMLLRFIKSQGYTDCTGVDLSAEVTALARRQGVDVETGELLDFLSHQASGSAQLVFLLDVLEHLRRDEFFAVLAEVRRVLAPMGRLVAHVPNAEGPFGMSIRYGDLTHELAFTRQSLSQALSACGFSAVRFHEDRPLVHGPISLARRLIWDLGSLPLRLLSAAETGSFGMPLSRNMTVDASVR